ncbi:MAG TPA: GNAT family N-acetyltransferase [Actinomycetes bacterium]
MGWRFTEDVEEYARAAGPLLAARPAEHTVSLTVIENARARNAAAERAEPEVFGWWTDATGAVRGAVSHTPGYQLLLGEVPDEAMRPLASELLTLGRRPPGVTGVTPLAVEFAAVWSALAGERAVLDVAMRLYRLGELVPPDPAPPGRARPATVDDTDLLIDWMHRFGEDAGMPMHDVPDTVADRLSHGGLTLWEDPEGTSVSLAGRTRPAAGVVRIGPVYTPPERRRHGWGAAVTAAASRATLDEGAREVVLFTDLANPTTNEIYQRLGYRPVSDRAVLAFEAATP